jgi:hypothetical protein
MKVRLDLWNFSENAFRCVCETIFHIMSLLRRLIQISSSLQFNPSDRHQTMNELREDLVRIRGHFLASSAPCGPSPRSDGGISVQFSAEQIVVMAETLGMDLTGSSNVTSSIRSLIASVPLDEVERKLQQASGGGFAAAVPSGGNVSFE